MSIPNKVFEDAERLAHGSGKSRSQLYSDALHEYVPRHALEALTETMNRVCNELDSTTDSFVAAAANRVLKGSEW